MKDWWKEAVVYQIYPRSFKDSNGDGIGDLSGIISKVDYLKNLGIDVVWLSPFYKSPNADNGYDISDYQAVIDEFGTMTDFDNLLKKLHAEGLKLVIDLVVNHSSDEHIWFQKSSKSIDNPYRNYYIWKKEIPNDWIGFFSGSAWELDIATNEYYLHYFLKKQPDLNWENPKLRQEIYKMMHFWLQKGVDGFRMDVISLISKNQLFPNFPKNRFGDLSFYANGPKVHDYLQEMNRVVLSKYDCMTVGEAFGVAAEQANNYVGAERKELNMIYHFDHAVPRNESCFINPNPEFTLVELKQIFNKWNNAIGVTGWNTVYFGNHDNPRMLSRFGNTDIYWKESAKMLATVLLTLKGTPFLYQGDEIGMSNANFKNINEYNDVQVINAYEVLVKKQGNLEANFLAASNKIARDHARTPMQWSAEANAGFSDTHKTWLKVNGNFTKVNVENQEIDEDSILNYYKKLLKTRKQHTALIYGDYTDLRPECNKIWLYTRIFQNQQILVMHNFTNKEQSFLLMEKINQKTLLLGNNSVANDIDNEAFTIKPFESRIYTYN